MENVVRKLGRAEVLELTRTDRYCAGGGKPRILGSLMELGDILFLAVCVLLAIALSGRRRWRRRARLPRVLIPMPRAVVIGGGLAGLAAAAALSRPAWRSDLFEARPFLGGRATSYRLPSGDSDTGRHRQLPAHPAALLRQPAGFLRAAGRGRPHSLPPPVPLPRAGRTTFDAAGRLAAGAASFRRIVRAAALSLRGRQAGGGARRWRRSGASATRRQDLDRITMLDWLHEKRQTPRRHRAVLAVRCWSARSTRIWTAWPRARLSGLLAGVSRERRRRTRWASPPCRSADLYGARSATPGSHLSAPVERIVIESGRVAGVLRGGRASRRGSLRLARCPSSAWPRWRRSWIST